MDKKSMGTFLTDLRKEKGLTQQEVADSLNVSNKTISKWERDEGYPEITILPEIARFYEITTDELLNGERFVKEVEVCDSSSKDKFLETSKTASIVSVTISSLSFLIYFIFCLFIDFTGFPGFVYGIAGCTIISLICFALTKKLFKIMKKEKKEITSNTINLLCFSGFFSLVNTLSLIFLYVSEKLGVITRCDSYIPFALLISIVIIYKMRFRLLKANNLYSISKENEKLKKKLSVISKALIVVAFIGAIMFALFETNNSSLYFDYDMIEKFVLFLQIAVMGVSIGSIGLIGLMTWIYNKKKI